MAITPNGRALYVVNEWSGTVTPISTATDTAGPAIRVRPVGVGMTWGIAITPDSKTAYVGSTHGVIPISTATNKAGAPIVLPSAAGALAITPDGKTVLAGGRETVTPISTATNTAGRPIGGIHSGADALVIAP